MTPEFTPPPAAPQPRLRWYQYRLRSLFLLMLVAAIPLGWLSVKLKAARQQKAAVEAIEKLGGQVVYDYQRDEFDTTSKCPGPAWLRKLLGDDLFANVRRVDLTVEITDADLETLKRLPQLQELCLGFSVSDAGLERLKGLAQLQALYLEYANISDAGLKHLSGLSQLQRLSVPGTKVTDAGLRHLKGLAQLRDLNVSGTKVSDAGVKELKKALPAIHVYPSVQTHGEPQA